jgi:flagellar hook assembly protein FlgD
LLQNYPNPFNPTTTIEYQIAKTSRVSLEIFDLLGQKIKTLVQNNHPSGVYRVHWDGKDQSGNVIGSGVYLYQLKIGNETLTRKMIMIK